MGRVQAWQFGTRIGVTPSAVSEAEAAPINGVELRPAALRFLRGQIVGGGWRGGLLFGRALDGVLTVTLACYGGPLPLGEPLGLDVSYALGVSDALEVMDPGTDWVGCWITAPGRRTGSAVEDLQWWRWGLARGLVGDRVPLLSVGWSDGALRASAYIGDDVNPDGLPVTWGTVY